MTVKAFRLSPTKHVVSLPPPRPHPQMTTTIFHKLSEKKVRHINRTRLATDQPKVFTAHQNSTRQSFFSRQMLVGEVAYSPQQSTGVKPAPRYNASASAE